MRIMLFSLTILLACLGWGETISAVEGEYVQQPPLLDLRQQSFDKHSFHTVRENWQVFWGELITPEEFASQSRTPSALLPYFNLDPRHSLLNGQPNPHAFGTFRLRLELPDHKQPFAIFIPEIKGASRA